MKKISFLILFCLGSSIVFGQTKKAFIKAAEKAWMENNYYAALEYYSDALEFNESDPELIYKVAESARKFNAYDVAAQKYSLLVDSLAKDTYPEAAYHLAEMKQRMGDYDGAIKYYQLYSEREDRNTEYDSLANAALTYSQWAKERHEDVDNTVVVEKMGDDVNTSNSDFGAIMHNDKMYYSSLQHEEQNTKYDIARPISKIHLFENGLERLLGASINDTDRLVAHTTFNLSGTVMYYTLCEYQSSDSIRCDIYQAEVKDDTTFVNNKKLSNAVNVEGYTNTQPQVAYDTDRKAEVLYFVSNRPGGKGGYDIYCSILDDAGRLSEAKNLMDINTVGNEVTPFYHTKSNTLYFSSDGRQGLGGYDIYSAKRKDLAYGDIELLQVPVNTSYHDIYYTVDESKENALFSSNRDGATYLDTEKKACCYDIFSVEYNRVIIDLDAITYDAVTREPLLGVTVHLIDVATGDTLSTVTPEKDSSHVFVLRDGVDYRIVAEKEEYSTETVDVSTKGMTESTKLIERIYMSPSKMLLEVFTFDNTNKEALKGATVRIIDVTDPNNPIYLETNQLSNDFRLNLEVGRKYEIRATRSDYLPQTKIVDLTGKTKGGKMRVDMYLDRFTIELHLPVVLYFDNDQPNPRSRATTSSAKYGNLYRRYLEKKPLFLKKAARTRDLQKREEKQRDIENFFDIDVTGGFEKMNKFFTSLEKELKQGRHLEIAIKGYTSPLAQTKYNLALGQRRVSSVGNEILAFNRGVFRPYVKSGQLVITDISFGEELSPKDVSDSSADKVGSIYSVGASKERRVEIISIKDQQ